MKVVLATGIYPPDIGGPATYCRALTEELSRQGVVVSVVTYAEDPRNKIQDTEQSQTSTIGDHWKVIRVAKTGGPIARWKRYAKALQEHASDADVVIALSSVSAGVPLMMAKLQKPKTILRLGGDFFWERYTDRGGTMTLKEWHESGRSWLWRHVMQRILRRFDHVVYSTAFQRDIHRRFYRLPSHSVLQNTSDVTRRTPLEHRPHEPYRLLFMGRFVGFKNLVALINTMPLLTDCCLTFIGEGPMLKKLQSIARHMHFGDRVSFSPSVTGDAKLRAFDGHDLLVLPSLTEISPHVAMEAAAAGLPVLLTQETGLSAAEATGMLLARLKTSDDIAKAVGVAQHFHAQLGSSIPRRSWESVADDWQTLFHSLVA